jgi:predicted DsbA family dithiol-disulfide isomerase
VVRASLANRSGVRIDLWTDIVCPWCYIGVTRFEHALERENVTIDLRLHPFQLDPEAPIPGIPALERYRQRFGDEAESIVARVTKEAEREGLEFRYDRALAANTFDAHRMLYYAERSGATRELERRLYRAYFTDGLDISDRVVLAACASDVGLDRDDAVAYLAGDDGVDEVRRELVGAFDRGITAVPTFVFDDEFVVPGAVDTEMFVKIIAQMQAMHGGEG